MKISRNDPCRCGSGKKYKKCCLAQDESMAAGKRAEQAQAHAQWREQMQAEDLHIEELIDLSNKANDLISSEQWGAAAAACHQLQEQFPDKIDGDHRFCEYYQARGDFAKARSYAQTALKRTEADPEKYHTDLMEVFFEKVEQLDRCIKAGRLVD